MQEDETCARCGISCEKFFCCVDRDGNKGYERIEPRKWRIVKEFKSMLKIRDKIVYAPYDYSNSEDIF